MSQDGGRAPERPLDPQTLRAVLCRQAATVAVITAPGQPPVGFTATSFTSVSLHPPLLSFCIAHRSSCWPGVQRAEYVAVHLLSRRQDDVARTFAASGIDRFSDVSRWSVGRYGVPLLHDVLAWLMCRVQHRLPAGDHDIVLVEPLAGDHADDNAPLLRHFGRYAAVMHEG